MPAELRNNIYGYVFENETLYIRKTKSFHALASRPPPPRHPYGHPGPGAVVYLHDEAATDALRVQLHIRDTRGVLALLYACKQVHYEAYPLIFAHCVFDCSAFTLLNAMVVTLHCYPLNAVQNIRMSVATASLVLDHPPLLELVAGTLDALTHVYLDEKMAVAIKPADEVVSILRAAFRKLNLEVVLEARKEKTSK
jgi:hypothetical protein